MPDFIIKKQTFLERDLKNYLAEYRKKLNLNQQELGILVGVSRRTISLIEQGDYIPSVFLAMRIAKVFNTMVEDIFVFEDRV